MRALCPVIATIVLLAAWLVACAPATATVAPAKPQTPAPGPAAASTSPPAAATAAPAQPTPTAAPKVKRGGTLRVAVQNDWVTFDTVQNSAENTSQLMVYDALATWRMNDKNTWEAMPQLAESWEFTDPSTVVFKLRSGIKFHDGSEFNAEVAKWNIDRMLTHPKSRQKGSTLEMCVAGTEAVDSRTFRVKLKMPCFPVTVYLSDAGTAYMLSKAAFDKGGEDAIGRNPVGTGPMQFVEWLATDHVTVKKFDGYWAKGADGQPLPYLDGIVYRLIVDDTVRLLELKSGNIQLTELIQGKDIPGLKANPDLQFVEGPWVGNHYRMIMFAPKGTFAGNLKLRQSLQYAVDREAMSRTLGMGAGTPARYVILPGDLAYDESVPYYSYDQNKAKQLLKEAGYPDGVDLTLGVNAREVDKQQAEMMQSMMAGVGVRLKLDIRERAAMVQARAAGAFEFWTVRNPTNPDPDQQMTGRWGSSAPGNDGRYSNPEVDKCLDQGRGEKDSAKRREVYKRCQTLEYNDAFHGYLWNQVWNWALSKKVKGFPASWHNLWELRQVWLDQ